MPIYKMPGKKDGLQKYRVRINFKDADGADKQIDRVAYGMDAAKELERQLAKEKKEAPAASDKMTVQGLYDEYIAAIKYSIRETTLAKKEEKFIHHILPALKNKRLNQLTPAVLQKWKTEIEEKILVTRTRKNIYSELRAMLNYAIKFGHITTNPLIRVGNFVDAYETKSQINYYTVDEYKKFINAAKKAAEAAGELSYEWNYYVFFNILFYLGHRKGEAYAEKWSDVEGNYLHIRRSIAQKLKGEDRETPPKNKSSYRTLQIPAPLRDTSVSNRNIQYSKSAGVKTIRIHDFRHSHATLLANEGINIQEIARRLGHAKIEITWNTYSHLYPREEERAVKVLDKIV